MGDFTLISPVVFWIAISAMSLRISGECFIKSKGKTKAMYAALFFLSLFIGPIIFIELWIFSEHNSIRDSAQDLIKKYIK